jgi:hypothetical protein
VASQLYVVDLDTGRHYFATGWGEPPEATRALVARYQGPSADWQRGAILRRGPDADPDEPIVLRREPNAGEIVSSEFFRGWADVLGYVDMIGALVLRRDSRAGLVGVARHRDVGIATDREVRLMRLLAPHLRRAVAIGDMLDMARRLAECIDDRRAPERIQHSLAEMLRFRLLMIAAGYEDGNDADSLRHDPLFKLANGRQPDAAAMCSQPTLSRLENTPGLRAPWWRSPARAAARCRAASRSISTPGPPRTPFVGWDDTFDAIHGGQQLRLFNAHYDEYGFQPIVVFDGDGRPVAAMLRPARRPTGAEARAFLRRLVREIRSHWPRVERIIARVEASTQGTDTRFVVTTLAAGSARVIYENLYCRRGQAENHIKA